MKQIWMSSKYEGVHSREWNFMGLVESRVRRPSLREITGLDLFFSLRPVKEHANTHRDACSLSSLKVKAMLDISQARVFL